MDSTAKIKPRIAKSPVQGSFVFASAPARKAEAPQAIRVVDRTTRANQHAYVVAGTVLRNDTTVKVDDHSVCPRRVSVRVWGCTPKYENFGDAVNAAVADALKVKMPVPVWRSMLNGAATILDISGTPARFHCDLSFDCLNTSEDVAKSQRDVMKRLSIDFDDAMKSVGGT
jgi:hypothetical protein